MAFRCGRGFFSRNDCFAIFRNDRLKGAQVSHRIKPGPEHAWSKRALRGRSTAREHALLRATSGKLGFGWIARYATARRKDHGGRSGKSEGGTEIWLDWRRSVMIPIEEGSRV